MCASLQSDARLTVPCSFTYTIWVSYKCLSSYAKFNKKKKEKESSLEIC